MFGDRSEQHLPSEPEEFFRRLKQDWYYRQTGAPLEGQFPWKLLAPEVVAFQLTGPLAACSTAPAVLIQPVGMTGGSACFNGFTVTTAAITITDAIGFVNSELLASGSPLAVPTGTAGLATLIWGIYQPFAFGTDCQCGSGSGSGSGSSCNPSPLVLPPSVGSGSGGSCPTGNCPGWVAFTDCNGCTRTYWGI